MKLMFLAAAVVFANIHPGWADEKIKAKTVQEVIQESSFLPPSGKAVAGKVKMHGRFMKGLGTWHGQRIIGAAFDRHIRDAMPEVARRLADRPNSGVALMLEVYMGPIDSQVAVPKGTLTESALTPFEAMRNQYVFDQRHGTLDTPTDGLLRSDGNSGYVWFHKNPDGNLAADVYAGAHAMAARTRAYEEARSLRENPKAMEPKSRDRQIEPAPSEVSTVTTKKAEPAPKPTPKKEENNPTRYEPPKAEKVERSQPGEKEIRVPMTQREGGQNSRELSVDVEDSDDEFVVVFLESDQLPSRDEDGPKLTKQEAVDLETALRSGDVSLMLAIVMQAKQREFTDPIWVVANSQNNRDLVPTVNGLVTGVKLFNPRSQRVWRPALRELSAQGIQVTRMKLAR